jgi:hypothetical protein
MLSHQFIKSNIAMVSIIIYITIYCIIIYIKPSFLYNKNGTLREFGIGTKNNTVIPAWLLAILISISSYFCVLYYLQYDKFTE